MKINLTILLALLSLICVAACSGGNSPSASSSPFLTWDAPVSDSDGTPSINLAGYRIYYGTSTGIYDGSIDVPGNVTQYAISDLSASVPARQTTYYIAVTAFDSDNNESDYSNEIIKVIN